MMIAIPIAIENRSGKIADRFSDYNRSAIFRSKSDPGFDFEFDPRLKTRYEMESTDGAIDRDPFFIQKSDRDFQIKIVPRFSFENRIPVV
jgi:hypothetical protein